MNDLEFVKRLIEVVAVEGGFKNARGLLKRERSSTYKAKYLHAAFYLAREHTELSWQELAVLFAARHHTTLMAGYRHEQMRLKQAPPRRDGRTWPEWHQYLLAKVGASTAAAPSTGEESK